MLFMEAGMIQVYANSPAPVHYREYFAGTAIMLVLTVLFNAGIETAAGAIMGVGPKRVIFLTNIGTNLIMNVLLGYLDFTFRLYLRGYYFPVMCVFEILGAGGRIPDLSALHGGKVSKAVHTEVYGRRPMPFPFFWGCWSCSCWAWGFFKYKGI